MNEIDRSSKSSNRFQVEWKWVVVFGAVVSRIVTTGTVICMGVFLDDLKDSFPGIGVAQLSLVFSTACGLLEGLGVVFSFLIKKFEARYMVFGGALLAFIGVMVSCFTTDYVVLLIGLGILNGLGQSVARFVVPVAVGYIFDDKTRHIGLSITNAGDGVGGVVFPILLTTLIDYLSWRNAMLITAGFILNLCISAAAIPKGLLFKKPQNNGQEKNDGSLEKLDSKNSINNEDAIPKIHHQSINLFPNAIFFYANILCHSLGYFVFMTFIYSEMKESQIEPHVVSRVASLIGGVSIIGRLSVSFMKGNDRVPRWFTYAVCHVIRGLSVLATIWAPGDVDSKVLCYSIVCSIYGLSDGITGALIPVVCLDLFGLDRFATIFGWEMLIMGVGALLGVPVAGAMKDWFDSYKISFIFSGCSFLLSGLILLPLFFTKKHYQSALNKTSKEKKYDGGVSLIEIRPKSFD